MLVWSGEYFLDTLSSSVAAEINYMLILGNSEVLWGKFDCVSYFSYHVGAHENLAMLKDLLLKGLALNSTYPR